MWATMAAIVPYDRAVLPVNQRLILDNKVANGFAYSDETDTDYMAQSLQRDVELISYFPGQDLLQSDSSACADGTFKNEPGTHASKQSAFQ